MASVVDRVLCNAIREPDRHYQLLGGKSNLVQGRRPSVRFLASAMARIRAQACRP